MKDLVTSSGVLKNREVPRVGIISANSEKLEDIWEDIEQGHELYYEGYVLELQQEDKTEEEIEELCEQYENDSKLLIFGDAWRRNADGQFEIDKTKSFAATYSSDTGNISVDWSKDTRQCHHTSPCYVMSNGDGPCGDLDTDGDACLAFDLPVDFYKAQESAWTV